MPDTPIPCGVSDAAFEAWWESLPNHIPTVPKRVAEMAWIAASKSIRGDGWRSMGDPELKQIKLDETAILLLGAQGRQMRVAYWEAEADPDFPWHVEDAAEGFNHSHLWPEKWQYLPFPAPTQEGQHGE